MTSAAGLTTDVSMYTETKVTQAGFLACAEPSTSGFMAINFYRSTPQAWYADSEVTSHDVPLALIRAPSVSNEMTNAFLRTGISKFNFFQPDCCVCCDASPLAEPL